MSYTVLLLSTFHKQKKASSGTSLAVQWLRLCASSAGDVGLIPGQGTKILHAVGRGQKKKKTTKTKNQNWVRH